MVILLNRLNSITRCFNFLCVLWFGLPSVECFELLSSWYVCFWILFVSLLKTCQSNKAPKGVPSFSQTGPHWIRFQEQLSYTRFTGTGHWESHIANEQGVSRTQIVQFLDQERPHSKPRWPIRVTTDERWNAMNCKALSGTVDSSRR